LSTSLGWGHWLTLDVMAHLVGTFVKTGQKSEGIDMLEQALEISIKVAGPDNLRTLARTATLASLYGPTNASFDMLREIEERLYRREQMDPLAVVVLESVARSYELLGRRRKARKLQKLCLEYNHRKGAIADVKYMDFQGLSSIHNLGLLDTMMGRLNESVGIQEVRVGLNRLMWGEEEMDTLGSMGTLDSTHILMEREGEAMRLVKDCVKIYEAAYYDMEPWLNPCETCETWIETFKSIPIPYVAYED
jgi:hypothetical protein